MEAFELRIISVKTEIQKDKFDRLGAHDVGNSGIFSEPKEFVVSYECETVPVKYDDVPVKVYFTHRFKFSELMSRAGGSYSCYKKESDFVLFIKGKHESHIGGLRADETYYTCYGQFISKFTEGERIWVKGTAERKLSSAGNNYIQLKRVKVDKAFAYHS